MNPAQRMAAVNFDPYVKVIEAKANGQIIIELLEPLSLEARRTVVLGYEASLKSKVDKALVVAGVSIKEEHGKEANGA